MLRQTIPTLTLALLAPLAGAAEAQTFVVQGKFLAGDPLAYSLIDACGSGLQEGIDSSCRALPASVAGRRYQLRATDDAGSVIAASACFYTADLSFSACDPMDDRVPWWARYVSISAVGGVNVRWTFAAPA